jgi:hypothetical protein
MFRYIDDDFVDRIYPIELEIKDIIGLLHTLTYTSKLTVRGA